MRYNGEPPQTIHDNAFGFGQQYPLQRRDAIRLPGVVQAVRPQHLPPLHLRHGDSIRPRSRLPRHAVEVQQALKGERDTERQLAGLKDIVQLETPGIDARLGGSEAALDQGDVEPGAVECTQPVCLVEKAHELLGVVAPGFWMEQEEALDASLGVVDGCTGDIIPRRVRSSGLQVKRQHQPVSA